MWYNIKSQDNTTKSKEYEAALKRVIDNAALKRVKDNSEVIGLANIKEVLDEHNSQVSVSVYKKLKNSIQDILTKRQKGVGYGANAKKPSREQQH